MAGILINMISGAITDQLETQKINEDYQNKLQKKMNGTVIDFINAVCVYLSNDKLQVCKNEKRLGNITQEEYDQLILPENASSFHINKRSAELVTDFLNIDNDELVKYLVEYSGVDESPKPTKEGGAVADAEKLSVGGAPAEIMPPMPPVHTSSGMAALSSVEAQALPPAPALSSVSTVPGMDMAAGLAGGLPGADALAEGLPGADALAGGLPGADALAGGLPGMDMAAGLAGGLPVPGADALAEGLQGKGMDALAGSLPGMDTLAGGLPEGLIKSNKAAKLLDFYKDESILRLQCNNKIHSVINDKLIGTIYKVAGDQSRSGKTQIVKEALKTVASTITTRFANQEIQSLTAELHIYQDIFSNEQIIESIRTPYILPYTSILLKLFTIYKQNELRDDKLELDVSIATIKKFNIATLATPFLAKVNSMTETNISTIVDLNKMTNTSKPSSNNIVAINEFKKIFVPETKKVGGNKRSIIRRSKRLHKRHTKHKLTRKRT